METQMCCPPAEREGLSKELWPPFTLLPGRKLLYCPLLSSWCLAMQFLLVCTWCLLSCYTSTGAQRKWVKVSLYVDPLRGTVWDSSNPLSHSASIPISFYSQKLWGFLFSALEPWAWKPNVRLIPFTPQRGPLQEIYPSCFLSATCGCGTNLFHISAPYTSLNVAFFF